MTKRTVRELLLNKWSALFALSLMILAYVLLVAIPVYGSGINHMSIAEIYEANNTRNLAEWYPLYQGAGYICRSDVYDWATLADMFYPLFTVPLAIGLLVTTRRHWPHWSLINRIPWLIVFAMYITVTVAYVRIADQAGAWLWD